MEPRPFCLNDWRTGVTGRREIGRRALLEAAETGQLEPVLGRIKREVGFDRLDDKDKNVFNVMASNLRRIAEGWQRLDERTRRDFAAGKLPYSALYKMVSNPALK